MARRQGLEAFLEGKILEFSEDRLSSVTSSLRIQAFSKGRKRVDLSLGREHRYYDLASLTKILFTTTAFMKLSEHKRPLLRKPLIEFLPEFKASSIEARQLLSHTAGLPWWAPYYKQLKGPLEFSSRWQELRKKLAKVKPEKRKEAVYSDVDFLFLGCLLQEIYEEDLLAIWEELQTELELGELHFNVGNKPLYKKSEYAPTEKCPWRRKLLQGEVHDDNAWALGGVASHAGLFGRIEDVSDYALRLRKAYRGGRESLVSQNTLKYFTRRKTPREQGDWGLGFMLPTKGRSSCGKYFSSTSFGHTGFTGTSFWYDPRADWLIVILSNRVYPTRENKKFVELRPLIHDWIRSYEK